ncbi:hypothetical protein FB451DRAFT_486380 [Mycena latifolia]|nr:hypothetical protein FB451DRAFT_486380 [Mycena latifolia]
MFAVGSPAGLLSLLLCSHPPPPPGVCFFRMRRLSLSSASNDTTRETFCLQAGGLSPSVLSSTETGFRPRHRANLRGGRRRCCTLVGIGWAPPSCTCERVVQRRCRYLRHLQRLLHLLQESCLCCQSTSKGAVVGQTVEQTQWLVGRVIRQG